MEHQSINDLMSLFGGYEHAYGTYKLTGEIDKKKVLGKASSLKGEVTVELWHKHIIGHQGLGIIPINENSQVKFAALDIDVYPLDLIALSQKVEELNLPLTVCRTKSGGAHLYMFMEEFVDALFVQQKMREFASTLGYGDCEIFPKQTKILVERGDIGQWINMPYFLQSSTNRYAIIGVKQLNLAEFILRAKQKRMTEDWLRAIRVTVEEKLPGGPPCLNQLMKDGFPQGTRNNGLLNVGVYYKKSNPDNWQKLVDKFNAEHIHPPLDSSEVLGVIKSLSKKDFQYMCKQTPIRERCNAMVCKTCEFGVGKVPDGMPKFGSLTKLDTTPPVWFLEVEGGGRLELNTEELQNPYFFQHKCMDILHVMPPLPKKDAWILLIQELLADVCVVNVPEEATPRGQLKQHLEDFCTSRVQGRSHDELLLGKPWTNNHRHYFRMRDFMSYLDRQKFKYYNMSYIVAFLNDMGSDKHFFNVRNKGVNCYSVPEFTNKQSESFEIPPTGKETPY